MTPCKRIGEVSRRALRFIRFEEEEEIQMRRNPPNSYDSPNRKAESSVQRSYKSKPYSKLDHHKVKRRKNNFPRSLIIAFMWMFQVQYFFYAGSWPQSEMDKKGENCTT